MELLSEDSTTGTNSEDYPIMASHLCFHWGPDFMLDCACKQGTKSKNEFYWLICRSSVVSHLQPITHRCVLHGYLMESLMSFLSQKKYLATFKARLEKCVSGHSIIPQFILIDVIFQFRVSMKMVTQNLRMNPKLVCKHRKMQENK